MPAKSAHRETGLRTGVRAPSRRLYTSCCKLPWFHNCALLDKVKDREERLWYVNAARENGWSRNVLVLQIESRLCRAQGQALTNFPATLPPPQSDLAQQILKDPYNFDFLTLTKEAQERDLERELLMHLRQFLMEMGVGFAFRQLSAARRGRRRLPSRGISPDRSRLQAYTSCSAPQLDRTHAGPFRNATTLYALSGQPQFASLSIYM